MRDSTSEVLELLEQGVFSWETVCRECLSYMSEDEVNDMAVSADFIKGDDEDDEDDE